MGLILTWCGAIAACWQLRVQKWPFRLTRAPQRGVLAYDPTTASTHYLGFQNGKWYHGTSGRVSLSTLAPGRHNQNMNSAILARFTSELAPYHPPPAIM